jgi:hypothetical protein
MFRQQAPRGGMEYKKLSGNAHDLPEELRKALKTSHRVVSWSAADPDLPYHRFLVCQCIGPLIVLPCFWPHLLILICPALCVQYSNGQALKRTYLVLTEKTLE